MSFTALLFCPDETTARLVTQVLSELDFTVEVALESFAAVQRLSEEHFHALVVDCRNEQDASLLFKAARNSEHNSGSLSVAVVEGQAGVAKAFRIGANLVLTRPINVEQSKSTLRVARGLLKKTQTKSTSAPTFVAPVEPPAAGKPIGSLPVRSNFEAPVSTPGFTGISRPAVNSPTPAEAAAVPFSGLLRESDPEPVTEASDAAVLESLPEITRKRSADTSAPALLGRAEPIAAGTGGQAAAPALAPETKPAEFRPAGAGPMVTNEPIVSTAVTAPEPSPTYPEPISAPSFSALESTTRSSGGGRFLKVLVILALLVAGGYFAWQQPKIRDYADKLLHRSTTAEETSAPDTSVPDKQDQTATAQAPNSKTSESSESQMIVDPGPTDQSYMESVAKAHPATNSQQAGAPEDIEIQELPISRDAGKSVVTPKAQAAQPIIVKSAPLPDDKPAPVAPPPVDAISGATEAKLPDLTPANFELPKASPGVMRISQGVSQGLLLKKVQPVYPPMAQQFHREGAVQLLATIDKFGGIKKVQVLSGDSMLVKPAVDAVKQWEYRPYLLNGQPVEIETQITIVFKGRN